MKYVIMQRTEDGTGYYTGGRCSGFASEIKHAHHYTTKSSANRKAREINAADKEFGGIECGPATVIKINTERKSS